MSRVVICLFGSYGYDRATQGVVGAGRALADELGGELQAIVIGKAEGDLLPRLEGVANAVVMADQEELCEYQPETCLQALEQLCREASPRAVLLSNDTYSQELAPRLAHRLGGSSMADTTALRVEGDALQAERSAYGGKATVIYELKRSPVVVWLRARAFAPAEAGSEGSPATHAALDLDAATVRIVERVVEEQQGVKLEDATLIVAGGRGLGGPEPFTELQKLADAIGAEMAASRAACDAGWVPLNWQVGQTGKKVAPELYLAIGISGASQHLLGMGDSKVIAAINTDPDAPIFKHCTFGIVEDYKNVVALLTEKVAELSK